MSVEPVHPLDPARRAASRATLAAALLGFFVITLDAVVVNVALPAMDREFGAGVAGLLKRLSSLAQTLVPAEDQLALNRRQAAEIGEAASALAGAFASGDIVIGAERLRQARAAFDRLTGRAGVEDVLDALFGRFCLGK